MGDRRGAYRVLVGRREGKRLLGRRRCRRELRRMNLAGQVAAGRYGRQERCIQGFGETTWKI